MGYMERNIDKRLDPRLLVDGAKSVISLMMNYYTDKTQPEGAPKISKYAFGNDYHFVIKDKLKTLFESMQKHIGNIGGRAFVDSAPVLERAWAERSGLGWIGKNAQLIRPGSGSYFFLAELIVDIELEYDSPIKDYCGTCHKCIDSCPTDAILESRVVDGSKCISYFTIETKGPFMGEAPPPLDGWVFGCDVCQQVCPWNRFSTKTHDDGLEPNPWLLCQNMQDWKEITEEIFKKNLSRSPLMRAGYKGLKRNLNAIMYVKRDETLPL
jgi:epoxyqueuosine reductase